LVGMREAVEDRDVLLDDVEPSRWEGLRAESLATMLLEEVEHARLLFPKSMPN